MKTLVITTILSACAVALPVASAQETAEKKELSLPLYDGDAWAMHFDSDESVATHRLTGMVCPYTMIEGYALVNIAQSGNYGAPIQCTYRNGETGGFTSISATWTLSEKTSEEMALRTLSISEGGQNEPSEDPKSFPVEVDFDGVVASDCHRIFLPFKVAGIVKTEWIETCQMGNWTFQINQTAPLTEQSFDAITAWMHNAQTDMAENLDNCIAPVTAPATEISRELSGQNGQLLLAVLNGQITMRAVTPADLRPTPKLTHESCMLAYIPSDDASSLILRDGGFASSSALPISILTANLEGVMSDRAIWVEKVFVPPNDEIEPLKEPPVTYALFGQDKPGSHYIYKLYQNAPPNDEQILRDTLKLFNGEIPPLAHLVRTPQGGWVWKTSDE